MIEKPTDFESFTAHALAYCSGQPLDEVHKLDLQSRTEQLWQILDGEPFLLVMDGLERILVAYNRLDAPRMLDDELDEQTANRIADAHGLHAGAGETFLARHRLRACTDPRAGRFLQALTELQRSRILVSSRLYPPELQTRTAQPLPGSAVHLQQGLATSDALTLWRELGGERCPGRAAAPFENCGPYPLFHADAVNLLAKIERDVGNTRSAIEATTHADELAWCDGPPYAYQWGLKAARKHLRALGAPEPELPPFRPVGR
jgi:hypothetical protein